MMYLLLFAACSLSSNAPAEAAGGDVEGAWRTVGCTDSGGGNFSVPFAADPPPPTMIWVGNGTSWGLPEYVVINDDVLAIEGRSTDDDCVVYVWD